MVNAVQFASLGGISFPNLAAPASSGRSSAFGPAFLLDKLGAPSAGTGGVYTLHGRAIVIDPQSSPQHQKKRSLDLNQARSLLREGDLAGARAAAMRVMENNPRDATGAYYVAHAHMKEGNYAAAERYFERAAAASEGNEQIAGDLRAVRLLQRDDAVVISEIRRLLADSQTERQGARLATYLIERSPDNVDARIALADFYEKLGKLNLAGAEFVDAIENVSSADRGTLLARLEQFSQSHEFDPGGYDLLARAYAAAGRLSEAEDAFEKALRLSDNDVDIQRDYAEVYTRIGREHKARGNQIEARRAFERALELNRDDTRRNDLATLEFEAAEKAMNRGNLRLALTSLDKARVNLPIDDKDGLKDKLIAAYERLASKLGETGDLMRVVRAREGAHFLDAADDTRRRATADAYDAWGLSLHGSGDYYGAIKAFNAALKHYTTDANYAAHLADSQAALGT